VPTVPPLAVAAIQEAYGGGQVPVGCLKQSVVVVVHQAEREAQQTVAGARPAELFKESPPIQVVQEDRLPAIPSRDHVADDSRSLDSQWAGHERTHYKKAANEWTGGASRFLGVPLLAARARCRECNTGVRP
jgi:hypothetical protein